MLLDKASNDWLVDTCEFSTSLLVAMSQIRAIRLARVSGFKFVLHDSSVSQRFPDATFGNSTLSLFGRQNAVSVDR